MKARVFTALGLLPIVVAALFAQVSWPLWALGGLVLLLAARELPGLLSPLPWSLPLLALLSWLTLPLAPPSYAVLFALWGLGVLSAASGQRGMWRVEGAAFWIAAPLASLAVFHAHAPQGALMLLFGPIWLGDTVALFAGKAFGKHKLAPRWSPKKTLEGAVAGLLSSLAIGAVLAPFFHYAPIAGAVAGGLAGGLGQAGDLFESALKRRAGIKDSGSLLPGHGGLLDRIDSLLFAAVPVLWLLSVSR